MRLRTRKTSADTVEYSWYVQFLRWSALRLDQRASKIVDRVFNG